MKPLSQAQLDQASPVPGQDREVRLDALDDRALLTSWLGIDDRPSEILAERLLAAFGSLGAIVYASETELARIPEVDGSVSRAFALLREFAVRLARAEASRRPVITSWTALVAYARTALAHQPREQFRALYLDKRNVLLRDELVAEGTVDHAPVYPREVVRRGLELSASALVLVHNHPSGDPSPSRADVEMTRKIVDAARVFELQVHDHLVVGRQGTASFRQLGLL